jgi:hypothetical protein
VRHLLGLFGLDPEVKASFEAMVKDRQDSGKVGKDFETEIDGKKIKIYLPPDVRDQYRALLLAETFLLKDLVTSLDIEPIYKNRMDIFNLAVRHLLIDGKDHKDFNVNTFDVDFIDTLIILYVTELLLPLYQRSSSKAEKELKANLKGYTIG